MITFQENFIEKILYMKLSEIILKEELNVARRKLQRMVADHGEDFVMDMILNIQDENVLDELVDELERQ